MNKVVKCISLVAALVVAAGVVLVGIGYAIGGSFWNIGLSNGRLQLTEMSNGNADMVKSSAKNSKELEAFHSIDISGGHLSIELLPTNEQRYYVHSMTQGVLSEPSIRVENGTLTITTGNENLEGLHFGKNRRLVQIYYPRGTQFETLLFHVAVGEVELEDVHFQTADVSMNAGDFKIDHGTIGSMKLNMNAGNFEADDFYSQELEVTLNVGDIDIDGELSGKSNLDVDVGNIEISLRGRREEYRMDLTGNMGSVEVDDRHYRDYQDGEATRGEITAKVRVGVLEIDFD